MTKQKKELTEHNTLSFGRLQRLVDIGVGAVAPIRRGDGKGNTTYIMTEKDIEWAKKTIINLCQPLQMWYVEKIQASVRRLEEKILKDRKHRI